MVVSNGQASSTYLRRFASAFGAGSVATTSKPRARYCAAQLAPITPVPTIAIRRTGLLNDIYLFLLWILSSLINSLPTTPALTTLAVQARCERRPESGTKPLGRSCLDKCPTEFQR